MTAIKTGRSPVSGWNSFIFRCYVVQTRWLPFLTDKSHEKLKRMAYKRHKYNFLPQPFNSLFYNNATVPTKQFDIACIRGRLVRVEPTDVVKYTTNKHIVQQIILKCG